VIRMATGNRRSYRLNRISEPRTVQRNWRCWHYRAFKPRGVARMTLEEWLAAVLHHVP
jgi:hypothetical protein